MGNLLPKGNYLRIILIIILILLMGASRVGEWPFIIITSHIWGWVQIENDFDF